MAEKAKKFRIHENPTYYLSKKPVKKAPKKGKK